MTEEFYINGKFHNFRDELLMINDKYEYEKTLERMYCEINSKYHELWFSELFTGQNM